MSPSDTAKLFDALPAQWQINIFIVVAIVHFITTHGGICGMWEVLKHGKKPPTH